MNSKLANEVDFQQYYNGSSVTVLYLCKNKTGAMPTRTNEIGPGNTEKICIIMSIKEKQMIITKWKIN